MEPGSPSRTALGSAHARAVHQIADAASVFPDPLALRIVGMDPGDPPRPGMPDAVRLFMAVRHRLAEDALAEAVAAEHTRQVVILGAGLDTFAYRNPHLGLRVFEVDHPDTQAWKRKRLADAGIEVPGSVAYCPVDFAVRPLGDGLTEAGFEPGVPSFFVWLGVVPYLTLDQFRATLRYAGGLAAGIVFDYNQPPSELPVERRAAVSAIATAMAERGEPWRSLLTPGEVARELTGAGFGAVEDLGWRQCLERYALDESIPDLFGGRVVRAASTG